ncbi:hypothetical protein AX17_002685 [Amanita inopinata Kibby_2008]|nr:hypothetical protein AX17_002685 [Amanita inopinata Kibby_2008]
MESTERLVRTWITTGRDQELQEMVSEISNDRTSLLNVVKALGEYLTSEEDELRTKGVDFLSSIIARCPPKQLNVHSIKVLTAFYCEKLNDTETIIPALKGLVTLTALPTFSSEEASTVIRRVFKDVKMKALVQSVRFSVFTIVDTLMARHRDTLKAMGKEFLDGYLFLADGEKDPRNLLIAFAIVRVILIEFDITQHVESFFNITFCYFPITFRPPPNDPYGISTDQLRTSLRQCLNATPLFGSLAMPLFLEKLLAGSPTTKRDTLQSMSACFTVYGPALARSFARKVWNSVKMEIFQPTDSITEQEALGTIQALVETIYSPADELTQTGTEDMQGLAHDACSECLQILKEPEKSQAKPAIKILCAFMTTTPAVARYTISQAVPHLVKLFMNPDEVMTRPSIILLLSDLIIAARDSSLNDSEQLQSTPLAPYKDDVFAITIVALGNAGSRRSALSALTGLVTTKNLLSDEEAGIIVNNISDLLQADPDEIDDTSDEMVDLLARMAMITPHHIGERTLPLLFTALPDTVPERGAVVDRDKCWRTLAMLSKLCTQADLFESLISHLLTKLELLCVPKQGDESLDIEPRSAYAHALLTTISRTLSLKMEKRHLDIAKHISRLVPQLFNLFLYSAFASEGQEMAATDHRVVSAAAQIITTIGQTLNPQRQEAFMKALIDGIFRGNLEDLAQGHQRLPSGKDLNIFESQSSSVTQKNTVALIAAALIPLHSQVRIPVPDLNQFLHNIFAWGLNSADNDLQRNSAWHIVATIVNKRTEDVSGFLESTLEVFWSTEVQDASKPVLHRERAIRAWTWLTKALLVRAHPLSIRFRDALFETFNVENIGWIAAKNIGEIAATDSILTKKNHAIVKFLYSQRYINQVLPQIVAGAGDTNKEKAQTAHLVALSSIIRSVPRAAFAHQMPLLIPLLLRGLDLPGADIRTNVINILLDAAKSGEPLEQNIISEHATSLVNAMLNKSTVDQAPSMVSYLPAAPDVTSLIHPRRK